MRPRLVLLLLLAALGTVLSAAQNPPAPQPPPSQQQQSDVGITISSGSPGLPPKYAVPDFIALSGEPETQAAAKLLGQVLWDDLTFEREFNMIPRDTYASIPVAKTIDGVAFDRWKELGADAVVSGTVQKDGANLKIQVKLYGVAARQSAFSREYSGTAANPRAFAHAIADEIHKMQRALDGVARTKLTFSSDRDRERITGTVEKRDVKEVYISDYDGENQRRITVNRVLNITPTWSPDGRSVAYTSYARGFPTIFVSLIYEGRRLEPSTPGTQNWLPVWSPDGSKIAFTSNRDGNPELYVMNRDGSNVRRLTNNPAIDTTPTWSPTGAQLAFTSDRSGSPAIYIMGADGLNLRRISNEGYCDRATWSKAPQFNEVAYVCRNGPGYDIKVYDFASGELRQITNGEGSNESPSFAPNGRHLVFTSTRAGGKVQVFTISRDGKDVRQITRVGNNYTPDWSR
jgi:TolB protein